MATLNFDATQVKPSDGSPDPLPAGWYNAVIDESEIKPTRDGAGSYLQLRFSVMDGHYANRKVFARLNLKNANEMTVKIAYEQLSAIAHAVGLLQVGDSLELHGKPMKIKVKVRPATGDYDASNDIVSWKSVDHQPEGAVAGVQPATAAPAGVAPAAPATPSTPPPAAAQPQAAPQPWQQPQAAPAAPQPAAPPAYAQPQQASPQPTAPQQPAPMAQPYQGNPQAAPPPWSGGNGQG